MVLKGQIDVDSTQSTIARSCCVAGLFCAAGFQQLLPAGETWNTVVLACGDEAVVRGRRRGEG